MATEGPSLRVINGRFHNLEIGENEVHEIEILYQTLPYGEMCILDVVCSDPNDVAQTEFDPLNPAEPLMTGAIVSYYCGVAREFSEPPHYANETFEEHRMTCNDDGSWDKGTTLPECQCK